MGQCIVVLSANVMSPADIDFVHTCCLELWFESFISVLSFQSVFIDSIRCCSELEFDDVQSTNVALIRCQCGKQIDRANRLIPNVAMKMSR